MQKRILPALFTAAVTLIIVISACTKIDTTTLGADALVVDNINTFADTLQPITTTQFTLTDSTLVSKTDNYVIGNLSTDPLFGKTNASVNILFKPTFFPYYYGNAGDTVRNDAAGYAGLDSVVVAFSYKGAWGDTTTAGALAQTFQVRGIVDANFYDKTDTVRTLAYQPAGFTSVLGSANLTPQVIASKVVFRNNTDSADNQIRIKIGVGDPGFSKFQAFFNQDSSATGTSNALFSDEKFKAFAASTGLGLSVSVNGQGNTLYYINMGEAKSRLEFHYRKTKNGVHSYGVSYFQAYTTAAADVAASPCANSVIRDYSTAQFATPQTDYAYLQTSPASNCFVNIHIPGLTNYPNRIIHRAYLIVEQAPNTASPATDLIYTAPDYLYLDLKETAVTAPQVFKPLYFDLSTIYAYNPDATVANAIYHPYPISNVELSNFGGVALQRADAGNTAFTRYEINLTRYVQHIASNGYNNYDMRLFAPYSYFYPQYTGTPYIIPYYNQLAKGRVRVGSGKAGVAHQMKLVIIYSKI